MEVIVGLVILGVIYAIFIWVINEGAEKIHDYRRGKSNKKFYEVGENQPTKNNNFIFKRAIENEFEHSIKRTMSDSIGKIDIDSPTMGMLVYSAIACTCKTLKETDFSATGMSKQEIDSIIDDIAKKMLHKYLEKY